MESMRNNHSLARSVSSVSLESVQQRHGLPRTIMDANNLDLSSGNHNRLRSNSLQDNQGSQTSLSGSSINGSVERIPMSSSYQQQSLMQHMRSKSEEAEQIAIDPNVNRSVSDCTGLRRSFRIPFERMVVGRRSIRKSRIDEIKYRNNSSGLSSIPQQRAIGNSPQRKPLNMTSLDLELELQAAYSKQV